MAKTSKKADDGFFRISQSKLNTWLKCRMAYWYKYVEKLRARRKKRPLQFGSMVHEMVEAYVNGDDPFELLDEMAKKQGKLFRQEIEEYGDIVADVRDIMTDYFTYHAKKDPLTFITHKGQDAEHVFEVTISSGIKFVGKIDGTAKSKNLSRWLVEHKSFSRMPSEDHRWRNLQSAVYFKVMDLLGWQPVNGIVWDYIKSKPPAYPEELKSGQLSQKGIDSLPTRTLRTIQEHGDKPTDFKTLLSFVEKNQEIYFPRIFTPVKKRVVDIIWRDVLEQAEEMAELHGKRKARTLGRHCEWCEYEPLCRAELRGLDVDYIKEKEFYIEEKPNDYDGPVHTD